jgi:hypothetical protein
MPNGWSESPWRTGKLVEVREEGEREGGGREEGRDGGGKVKQSGNWKTPKKKRRKKPEI